MRVRDSVTGHTAATSLISPTNVDLLAGSMVGPMDLGALIFSTDLSVRPDVLARELEDRGFESLWVTEHTHIPTSRLSPWPGGTDLPEEYKRTLDPFVALTSAAAATTKLRLATGICLVAQHDPKTCWAMFAVSMASSLRSRHASSWPSKRRTRR
jgi:hypothetical protein